MELQNTGFSDIKNDTGNKQDPPVALSHATALANKKCHEKVDFYLHRPVVEYLVIFLIILDALLVTASLLIEIKIIENTARNEGSKTSTNATTHAPAHTTTHATEDAHAGLSSLEHAAEALHLTSLVILAVFMVEVLLKLYGQREKFFKRKIQVVDSFVVAISFALDIAIVIINDIDSTIIQGLGLIIILRLWRLVRIVNGAVVATEERLNESVHEAKRETAEAKENINLLEMQLEEKNREIVFLKGRLCKYEPIDMVPTGSTRLPAYLPETREFPKQVLGDVTDDEEYRLAFSDLSGPTRSKPRPALNYSGNAFQSYQPGATYQPTSQYPETASKPPVAYRSADVPSRDAPYTPDYHDNDMVDTADESDVVSIKPAKSRSGNTFTVRKDGVPMTSL